MNVRLITDDLLFGSKVEAMIREAGGTPTAEDGDLALTILDLTDGDTDVAVAAEFAQRAGAPVLAYYAHTNDEVRTAAIAAGIDKIVPRSRMMREGPELIAELAGT
ncbi:MAG: hypothetical protein QM648_12115 [Solirubrobacterales bacterium]